MNNNPHGRHSGTPTPQTEQPGPLLTQMEQLKTLHPPARSNIRNSMPRDKASLEGKENKHNTASQELKKTHSLTVQYENKYT